MTCRLGNSEEEKPMTQFYAMAIFALTLSISPGPVNIIALSTGLNYGIRKAINFVSGATISFTLLLLVIGLTYQEISRHFGNYIDILTIFGALLISYFGYKLITSNAEISTEKQPVPSFWSGVSLQLLNPKAWGACLAAVSLFNLDSSKSELYYFVMQYFIICFFGIGSWAVLGSRIKSWLNTVCRRMVFNSVLGALMIGIACLLLMQEFLLGDALS